MLDAFPHACSNVCPEHSPEQSTQLTQRNSLTHPRPEQRSSRFISRATKAVDKSDFDVTAEDVERTGEVLRSLAARQEVLAVQVEGLGLDFCDRMDWLATQRSADERLVWERKWRWVRGSLASGRTVAPAARVFPSRSVPKPKRRPVFTAAQIAIATAALERRAS